MQVSVTDSLLRNSNANGFGWATAISLEYALNAPAVHFNHAVALKAYRVGKLFVPLKQWIIRKHTRSEAAKSEIAMSANGETSGTISNSTPKVGIWSESTKQQLLSSNEIYKPSQTRTGAQSTEMADREVARKRKQSEESENSKLMVLAHSWTQPKYRDGSKLRKYFSKIKSSSV